MKKIFFAIVLVVAALIALRFFREQDETAADRYKRIESPMTLTESQKLEVPSETRGTVAVHRFRSSAGFWMVSLGAKNSDSSDDVVIGELDLAPSGAEIASPVYECSYSGFKGETVSLDMDRNCSGEGKLVSKQPVGFVSSKIRTGFRMLVRCRDAAAGFYLSLNPTCESASDRLHGTLGSIRSAK